MSGQQTICSEVLDHLALIIDGDETTLERFADHLAECDQCRDLRHEAQLAAELTGHSGADYVHPEDMNERLFAALDQIESETAPQTPDQPAQTPDQQESAQTQSPETIPQQPDQAPNVEPMPQKPKRKILTWIMAAAAILLVAGGGVGLLISNLGNDTENPNIVENSNDPNVAPQQRGIAAITQIVRAASDQSSGVTMRASGASEFAQVSVDTPITGGSTVRTDERTRAQIRFLDGTSFVLNHNTEITFDSEVPRTFHIANGGEVLAEVTRLNQGPNATFVTPTGQVEVLGTKLLISATDQMSSVRVTRGAVRVHGNTGTSAEVKAGEEGTIANNGTVNVSQAVNLARSVSWSELTNPQETTVRSFSGIGSLRARRPGEREGQERPLALTNHKVRVRIVGNVARTEIEEVFRNNDNVTLEGIYRFPMPPDARIARLSLDVEGTMEEGAFLERDQAQKIWRGVIRRATPRQKRPPQEEFVWVPGPWRDPALLEWQRGGQFELRIFPIKAHSERRVIIAYEQTIQPHGNGRRYVYPLPHSSDASTRVGLFELDMRVAGADPAKAVNVHNYNVQTHPDGGATRVRMTQANFLPSGDLVVDYTLAGAEQEMRYWTYQGPAAAAPTREGRRAGSKRGSAPEVVAAQKALSADQRPYVVFALRPELPMRTQNRPRDYVIVVDSSQSMVGENYSRSTELVTGVIAEMDRRDRFTVLACDTTCQGKPEGPRTPSSEAARETQQWLSSIRPAGASNIMATLSHAAQIASQTGAERDARIIYIGDGVSTIGHRRANALAEHVRILARNQRYTFTTVSIGGDADSTVMGAIARTGGGHYIPYTPGQRASATALQVLETTYGVALRNPVIEFPAGVTDVAPTQLPTLRAGEEVLVTARFTGEVTGQVVLRGDVGGQPYSDRYPVTIRPSTSAGNAFVPRMWASSMIDELQLTTRSDNYHRIVALSRGYGVMSRHTSLLVLESEAMFRAFGVDRARPTIEWTGEDDLETNESTGMERHAKAVTTRSAAPLDSLLSGSIGGGSARDSSRGRSGIGGFAEQEARPAMKARGMDLADDSDGGSVAPAEVAGPRADAAPRRRRRASRSKSIRPRGPGRWMRRVWERVGSVNTSTAERSRDRQNVIEAETALREQPDSRDRHRTLFRALARVGDLERAEDIAEQWLSRDQLDPEALIALSDVLGRQGRRDEALRMLTGIVDLEPNNTTLHQRLVDSYDRAGQPASACNHRIAMAEIDGADTRTIGSAIRCQRALGNHLSATWILDGLPDSTQRTRVERAATNPPRNRGVRGDLMVEATWSGPQDLDISLINHRGQRISWMGGRRNVVGESAHGSGRERLGLRWTPVGTYFVEISRTDPADNTPISGQVSIRVLGQRRSIPFTLTSSRTVVGSARVRRVSRMVSTF